MNFIKPLTFLLSIFSYQLLAQEAIIHGTIINEEEKPVSDVNIKLTGASIGASSTKDGNFRLTVRDRDSVEILFKHIEYKPLRQVINLHGKQDVTLEVILQRDTRMLQQVQIAGEDGQVREQVSLIEIDPKTAKMLPSPFGEFNQVLTTLPGVTSNNELSATYSVRGGNFDENLVYVNGIRIYRPFLVRAGQQEGLSFINPDLVENIEFSSGGWQPKYGDKLSSSLNITYKKPEVTAGSLTLSLLGGAAHFEGANKDKSINYILGARHKSSSYLLNTLEVEGEYLPRFSDIQSYINFDLGQNGSESNTELGVLLAFARNRYFVEPKDRESTFGTFNQSYRLFVDFEGREIMQYDTYQFGTKLSHTFNKRFRTDLILSNMYTREKEYFDVEGGYRLCDVNNNPGSADFNECITIRGIGTNFSHARNRLTANIVNAKIRSLYSINRNNTLELGIGYSNEKIDDHLDEYTFTDSADYVTVTENVKSAVTLNSNRLTGYIQNATDFNGNQSVTYGVRLNYWDLNGQLLVSPRIQYAIRPVWQRDVVIKAAAGFYQQPPFYRELRNAEGEVNKNLKAQSSVHAIVGVDYNFRLWGRNFKFLSEAYYKYLYHVIPYDVDNVRIRYFAENNATAYAAGVDFRVSGEFIEGSESWFSLGILTTREDVECDNKGYIRRPSDQRINLGIFFQDHIPNDPTIRMYLKLLYGSGLPFGPPNSLQYRNSFIGRAYRRVDIGFSKMINFKEKKINKQVKVNSLWLGVEILNLLGADNVISYTWIEDVNSQQFGVPNTLSARFFNLKLIARF